MYEETDRCPKCGRYVGDPPWFAGSEDEFSWIGGGTSHRRLFLYSQTGGILRYQDGTFMQTTGALDEASYRR